MKYQRVTSENPTKSPLDRPLTLTKFRDVYAFRKSEFRISLRALVEKLWRRKSEDRSDLPLLKLGAYGELKSADGSLRTDENMLNIDGIECDYDGGEISVDEAVSAFRAAGIVALVHTTGRHTRGKPRWRALLPTSRTLPVPERYTLVARANGVLGGKLAKESFTDSQAFFYGFTEQADDPRVELVEGGFIDEADHLDAGALDKDGRPFPSAGGESLRDRLPYCAGEDVFGDEEDDGLDTEPDREEIEQLIAPIPNGERDIWFTLAAAIHEEFRGSEEGFEIWEKWSRSSHKYDPLDQQRVWESLGRYGGKRLKRGTLHHLASKYCAVEKPEQHSKLVAATPYVCRNPGSIPLRPWLYGRQLLRGSLSLVVAPGATGKTALLVGSTLAMAVGKSLLGTPVWDGPKRVWFWNLEDSSEELARLIEAARIHWEISPSDLGDRLFVDSGLDGAELTIAIEDRDGVKIVKPIIQALVEELLRRSIDILIIDPFVASHSVNENNNCAINAIAKEWARVAVRAECSVVLVHHTGKLRGIEVTSEQARGASSLVAAARSVTALNKMTAEEAKTYGIEGDQRRRFFRAYDDKNNRTPPADGSDWYQLVSVHLGNGLDGTLGDSIQVVEPWIPPDAAAEMSTAEALNVHSLVSAGKYRKNAQSTDWVGCAFAKVLGLDLGKPPDKHRAKKLVEAWLAAGYLEEEDGLDAARRHKVFVRAGDAPSADVVQL